MILPYKVKYFHLHQDYQISTRPFDFDKLSLRYQRRLSLSKPKRSQRYLHSSTSSECGMTFPVLKTHPRKKVRMGCFPPPCASQTFH